MSSRAATSPWWVRTRPNPRAELRLFCFPYAGGAASSYFTWQEYLPPSVEVFAAQPPGRANRLNELPLKDIDTLVAELGRSILPHLDRPFAFFGHSMGAVIAFELVRLLRRDGRAKPFHLFVSGREAPHAPDPRPPTYNLPEPEFIEALGRLKGTPQEVLRHEELMRFVLPLLRADFEAIETYVYKNEPPLDCPITAFVGLHDDEVSREQLEMWAGQTKASFSARVFPGDHFFLHTAQPALLKAIAVELFRHRLS
ncbi:MAG: thioesterase II family protein [Pyrinomonadaceae bacterium]